jgi:hypothetical protein
LAPGLWQQKLTIIPIIGIVNFLVPVDLSKDYENVDFPLTLFYLFDDKMAKDTMRKHFYYNRTLACNPKRRESHSVFLNETDTGLS